jgi:hypothetical protein
MTMERKIDPAAWYSRRRFLSDAATGLSGIALAWLLQKSGHAADFKNHQPRPHFTPKAKRIIHIFTPGGVSHVDTFDYKPDLEKHHGQPLTGKGPLDPFFGKPGQLMKSPYAFRKHGQSGLWVSDLLPRLGDCVDDLCFLHAVTTKSSSHTPACFQMNTGFTQNGYPSVGAWLSHGLGTMNEQLPTFVVLPDPRGLVNGGSNNWSNGFLPAEHQGVAFRTDQAEAIAYLNAPEDVSGSTRQASLNLLNKINRRFADENPGDSALSARVTAYELAARMQSSIPDVLDLRDEPELTKKLYGMDHPLIASSARNYLLACRLLERGVRFVQIYNGGALGSPRINWDAHEDLKQNHDTQAIHLDQPCAALLMDLKRRGLLDDTLVFWSSEFGRTPFKEGVGGKGRDHHPLVFTCWLAGAGVKKGFRYGSSDEVGYQPGEKAVTVYDLHATILHLLGIDHTKLTFYHNGIQRRLTDVHGEVIDDIVS